MDIEDETFASSGTHLVERVVGYFRNALEKRLLHPGDQLPPERVLARQLNVSRATLRHAIGYLAAMGILRIRRGVGTFVADGPPEIGNTAFRTLGTLHAFQPWQVQEARRILEGRLAALAAERGQQRDFATLAEEVAEIYASSDDPAEYRIHDLLFHRAVAHASGNPILAVLMETVLSALYVQSGAGNVANRRDAAGMHREIYRSIRSRNAVLARELMAQHLREADGVQKAEAPRSIYACRPMASRSGERTGASRRAKLP
ncbi:MAG: FadR/GntR family transcriptional regulator [Acidobacteriota bacterium]